MVNSQLKKYLVTTLVDSDIVTKRQCDQIGWFIKVFGHKF